MTLQQRLNRVARLLDQRRTRDTPHMSAEDRRIAQRIVDRHYERFGPPPANDHASIVRWLVDRSGDHRPRRTERAL